MRNVDPVLYEKLEKLISSMGYELFGAELLPMGGHQLFRIYIDKEQGVTVDDCSKVSRQISAMLDVEDLIQGRYHLEVSSPGINRPLFVMKHYQKHIGSQVQIRLHAPIDNRRQFKGTLTRVVDEEIYLVLEDSGQEVVLPFSAIEKANLIGDIRL